MKIRQFDAYPNPSTRGVKDRPYVVVVQADVLDLATRIVVPLVVQHGLIPIVRLNPVFEIKGQQFYLHPIEIAALPARTLQKPVANLEGGRERIIAALDLVFTGI